MSEIDVDFEFDFSVTRIMDDQLLPTRITGSANIIINPDMENEEKINNGIERIQFWLHQIVDGSVMFCPLNDAAMGMLYSDEGPRISNLIMMTPDEPLDEQIAMLLRAKMSALGDGAFTIVSVRVKSSDGGGLTFKFSGDDSDILPGMDDWVTVPNWFKKPWWHRCDGSTIDMCPSDGDDLAILPEWRLDLDFLTQPTGNGGPNNPPSQNKLAPKDRVVTGFRPKVVDGGKSD